MNATRWDAKAKAVQDAVFARYYGGRAANIRDSISSPKSMVRPDGVRITADIRYADRYPNSFFDIYEPADESSRRPTVIYFHGGGFLFGSKSAGDPLGAGAVTEKVLFDAFLSAGWNVVTADYGLAPECRYPVQIEQVDEVCSYVLAHAEELHADSRSLMVAGSSSGANLAEIYALMVADPAYADRIGFAPSLPPDRLRAVLIDEAALGSSTHGDENMDTMAGCWLGVDDVRGEQGRRITELLDVPRHIRDSYPPAAIVSSNVQRFFPDSAHALNRVLDDIAVPHLLLLPSREEGAFDHGFLSQEGDGPVPARCRREAIDFMASQIGAARQ